MSGQPGNPNAGGAANTVDRFASRDCPFCDASVKRLPNHLRNHCPETGHGEDTDP